MNKEVGNKISSEREKKGWTQTEMANKLGMTLRQYSKYEGGNFPKFKTGVVKKIDKILGTNAYESLYEQNNSEKFLPETVAREMEPTYVERRRQQKSLSPAFLVPLVPVKARAGYVSSYDQTDYLSTLEQYALPPGINPVGAIWRYFELEGESMEPTFGREDVVLASQVPHEDWQEIRNFYIYVIVTNEEVWIKRIFRKNLKTWVMISDNESEYPQKLLPVSDIKELWVFRRRINSKAPPPKKFEIKV